MSDNDSTVINFRVEEPTKRIIKKYVVNDESKYSSQSDFGEKVIKSNAGALRTRVIGGSQLMNLVEKLNRIEGVAEQKPAFDVNARFGQVEKMDRHISTELSMEDLGALDDIQDEIGADRSTICRICIFKELFKYTRSPANHSVPEHEVELINATWSGISTGLDRVAGQTNEILHRLFVLNGDSTRPLMEKDQRRASRFAQVYKSELWESELLEEMKQRYDERTYTDVENIIQETTEVDLEASSTAEIVERLT